MASSSIEQNGLNHFIPSQDTFYGASGEGMGPNDDAVAPGIYGGAVARDENGEILVGHFETHNPFPGPIYAGGGYAPIALAIQQGDPRLVQAVLDRFPALVNDVMTGGANPLHICGMSTDAQHTTGVVIAMGGDIEAPDMYGYRPLHRMASNNLVAGAAHLLAAGAELKAKTTNGTETALSIAYATHSYEMVRLLQEWELQAYLIATR